MSEEMIDVVFCQKYKEELPRMVFPPLPGERGKAILEQYSQKAFDAWKFHQTTLINERKLDLSLAENRTWLIEEMYKFLQNEEVAQAEGFVEPIKEESIVNTYTPPIPPPFV